MFTDKCLVSNWFAYLMFMYLTASLYYFIRTRSIGTPFNDSLTPAQLELKNKSSRDRKSIFFRGLFIGILTIYFFEPFSGCSQNFRK